MLMIQAAAIALIALILTPGLLFYFDVTPKLVVLLLAAGVALLPLRRSRSRSRDAHACYRSLSPPRSARTRRSLSTAPTGGNTARWRRPPS